MPESKSTTQIAIRQNGRLIPEHTAWRHMKERCLNPRHPYWKHYGGRGITICKEWIEDFAAFFADMGPRPSEGHTLERVDNDSGYCKSNCVWATRKEQSDNTRKTVHHELNGEEHNQSEWGRLNGIPQSTISLRLKRGWSLDDALTKAPVCTKGRLFTHDGKSLTIAQWSRETGVAYKLISQRLKNGWTIGDAVSIPSRQKA